jgi:hypothetical protein
MTQSLTIKNHSQLKCKHTLNNPYYITNASLIENLLLLTQRMLHYLTTTH